MRSAFNTHKHTVKQCHNLRTYKQQIPENKNNKIISTNTKYLRVLQDQHLSMHLCDIVETVWNCSFPADLVPCLQESTEYQCPTIYHKFRHVGRSALKSSPPDTMRCLHAFCTAVLLLPQDGYICTAALLMSRERGSLLTK